MTIEKITVFESFLIRGDGKGGLQAAHVEYLELIKDGDEVLSAKILPAQPLGITPKELAPALGAALTAALETNEAQAAEIATLTAAEAEAEAARDKALADVAALTEQLAAMQPQATPAKRVATVALLIVMRRIGLRDQLDAVLDSLPAEQSTEAKEMLSLPYTRRDHPLVLLVQQAFKWTDAQVDDLFAEADAV